MKKTTKNSKYIRDAFEKRIKSLEGKEIDSEGLFFAGFKAGYNYRDKEFVIGVGNCLRCVSDEVPYTDLLPLGIEELCKPHKKEFNKEIKQ